MDVTRIEGWARRRRRRRASTSHSRLRLVTARFDEFINPYVKSIQNYKGCANEYYHIFTLTVSNMTFSTRYYHTALKHYCISSAWPGLTFTTLAIFDFKIWSSPRPESRSYVKKYWNIGTCPGLNWYSLYFSQRTDHYATSSLLKISLIAIWEMEYIFRSVILYNYIIKFIFTIDSIIILIHNIHSNIHSCNIN